MRTLKCHLIVALSLALLFSAVMSSYAQTARKGAKSPSFKLPSINGRTLTLDQIRKDPSRKNTERVVVLNFWATTCPHCVDEIPHLQKLHTKYASKGLAVVGIAVDSDGFNSVKPFVKARKLTYTILSDRDANVMREYGVRGVPTTFILDKKGVVQQMYVGAYPGMEKDIERSIVTLMK